MQFQNQQNDMLQKAMERMQLKEATKTYNDVVERCFELDSTEAMCMDRCFEKFVKYTQRLSTAFQEQNLLAADELQQPK